MAQTKKPTRVTAQEIREIVGRISDDRISAILATGATSAQVLEAFSWLGGDEEIGATLERPLTGIVAQVYEILKPDQPDIEEERPRR